MMKCLVKYPACVGLLLAGCAFADQQSVHHSDYAGQEARTIRTLSADDVEQLRTGGGWGLAKAAELNGMPGPKHVLEMKAEIALDARQEAQIQAVFEQMREAAIPLGVALVERERELNAAFASGEITRAQLADRLDEIASLTGELRFVHLAAHLTTSGILSAQQTALYNELRGYASADPCASVPEGHDAAMWKRHNGCTVD